MMWVKDEHDLYHKSERKARIEEGELLIWGKRKGIQGCLT